MSGAPITTGIVLIMSFHIFVTSIYRSLYLERFWNTLRDIFLSAGTLTSVMMHVFSLSLLIVTSGQYAFIFLSVLIMNYHRIVSSALCVTGYGECLYHFSVWDRLTFLHNIQCMKLANRS